MTTDHDQDPYFRNETRDGMRIEWQVPIQADDGVVLRADVYRPLADEPSPVILSYGAYGKGMLFSEGYPVQWASLMKLHPEIAERSSGKYMNWEVVDPERFVPAGYAVVRVDSRGAGWSPGYQNYFSSRETRDLYDAIEWAGTQPWSNGKIGLLGVSYYAENQWCVAELAPPHLAAMIPWAGYADVYRDLNYHGGILCEFMSRWDPVHLLVQYGAGERALRNPNTGESVAGPVTLSDDELAANRIDLWGAIKAHPFADEFHAENTADLAKVTVPLLSVANWGGQGMHTRGNFNGFTDSSSEQKWLLAHGSTDPATFYNDEGVAIQKRFFDHFLKGEDNGWDKLPPVLLQVRHPGERFVRRAEREWPVARTSWTELYLDADTLSLSSEPPGKHSRRDYSATGDGLTFWLPAQTEQIELTGPSALKLFIDADTEDTDLFIVLQLFDPDRREVTFQGAMDPTTPIANGWLRASHRRIDPTRSKPYQPFHPHDRREPLDPGQVYEVDIEIWPTCVVIPVGYQLALNVRGRDYEFTGEPPEGADTNYRFASRGTGGMTHNDPDDRPLSIFGGTVTIHTGGNTPSRVLLPFVPPADEHLTWSY